MTLSVQNLHIVAEEEHKDVVHAARRGGTRRAASRPSARGGASRWALGAGAATAGIAIMGRNRRVRKAVRKVVRSKAMRGIRSRVVGGLRKVRSTTAVKTARRFVGARKASVKRIGIAAKGAASRVYGRVKSRVSGGYNAIRRYATGARKRTTIAARRTSRGTSRSVSRVRRFRSSGGGNRRR